MGIIQKQAVRTMVITIAGTAIGMCSQLLMPFILSTEEIGTLSIINATSVFLATIFSLGFTQIALRRFSNYRDQENGHGGFLVWGIILSLVGVFLAEITFYLFQDFFIGDGTKNKLIQTMVLFIVPIIFFRILFKNTDIYMRMLFSSIIGAFLESVLLKFVILISLLLFWLNVLNFKDVVIFYTIALCLPGFILVVLSFFKTNKIKWPIKKMLERKERKIFFTYGFYGVLASASGIIILSFDQLMLNNMLSTEAVGIYSVLFFAGSLVSIPARGIKRIAVPVLSESFAENDMQNIQNIYEKSVKNQTVTSLYLLIVGWACIGPVLSYLPEYEPYLYVFFFIGFGQLLDMMTGVNMEILATSPKYKMNMYFNLMLAALVIGLNFIFITEFRIIGAAVASLFAMGIINVLRWYYLYKIYKLQPFDKSFLKTMVLGLLMLIGVSFLSFNIAPLLAVLIYGVLITAIYWSVVLKFNLAPDIADWFLKMKRKFIGS